MTRVNRVRALVVAGTVIVIAAAALLVWMPWNGADVPDPTANRLMVRNGAELKWDQAAQSADELRGATFVLHVDGVAMPLDNANCDLSRTAGPFECAVRLPTMSPGAHTLQLVTFVKGLQSAPSVTLSVWVEDAPAGR